MLAGLGDVQLRSTRTSVRLPSGDVVYEERDAETGEVRVVGGGASSDSGGGASGGPFMVIDTAPDEDLACVVDGLVYVGSQDASRNWEGMMEAGVGAVVNVGVELPCVFREQGIEYGEWPILDLPDTPIDSVLAETTAFIHEHVTASPPVPVLVHCNAGVSRSVTVVCAYLITTAGLTYPEALAAVRAVRPSARPNDGFAAVLASMS